MNDFHATFPESTRERFEAWRLLCALRAAPSARVIRTALTSLECGSMARALKAGAVAFEQGLDTSFDLESIVTHAWETRIELELHAEPIVAALDHIDAVHDRSGPAVLLIDDGHWVHRNPPIPLVLDRWWGLRAALDVAVPPGVVENALISLRRTTP